MLKNNIQNTQVALANLTTLAREKYDLFTSMVLKFDDTGAIYLLTVADPFIISSVGVLSTRWAEFLADPDVNRLFIVSVSGNPHQFRTSFRPRAQHVEYVLAA